MPCSPAGTAVEELRPRRCQHKQGARRLAQEMLQEIEQRLLGPVEILDHDDRGPSRCDLVEELDPGTVEPLSGDERVQVACDVEAQGQPEDLAVAEALADDVQRVALQQPEVLLEHLPERPVRDSTPVCEAAAAEHERRERLGFEPLPELSDEARLPDAGIAHDRHEMKLLAANGTLVRRCDQLKLRRPPHERAPQAAHATRPRQRHGTPKRPARDATRLSLRFGYERVAELERAGRRGDRPLAYEDLTRGRGLFESCGDVDRVSGSKGASLVRLARENLTRIDAQP